MSGARRRLRTLTRSVTTGGTPGGGGNLAMGPDYGSPPEMEVGASFDIEAIAFGHQQDVSGHINLGAVAFAVNDEGVGGHLAASYLGAPIAVTQSNFNSATAASSFSMFPPSGIQNGDVLLMLVGTSSAVSVVTSTGFTSIRSTAGTGVTLAALYKVASGESGNYTVNLVASSAWICTIILIRGAAASQPDVSAATAASATDPVAPTITTTVANALKVAVCVQANTLDASYTPPAGYVEHGDNNGQGTLGLLEITGEVTSRPQAVAGASGTATMDSTQALASNYVAMHIGIAPGSITLVP